MSTPKGTGWSMRGSRTATATHCTCSTVTLFCARAEANSLMAVLNGTLLLARTSPPAGPARGASGKQVGCLPTDGEVGRWVGGGGAGGMGPNYGCDWGPATLTVHFEANGHVHSLLCYCSCKGGRMAGYLWRMANGAAAAAAAETFISCRHRRIRTFPPVSSAAQALMRPNEAAKHVG